MSMTNHPNRNRIAPLSALLDWKLLDGSHDFPGPDGGTCINEAAIVAAGFEYKKVQSALDCPPCFSRPIAQYAIGLNDYMPAPLRQKLLMPFVTRLAGTADKPDVEVERARYIALQTIRRVLPPMLRSIGLNDHADACASATNLNAGYAAAAAARADAADAARAAAAAAADAARAADAGAADADAARAAAAAAADAARAAAARAADARKEIWLEAVAILDGALKIGKQADKLDSELVASRFETIKAAGRSRTPQLVD